MLTNILPLKSRQLVGTVTWTYRKIDRAATELLLDTKGVNVKSVTTVDGATLVWKLGADHEVRSLW